jgi:hypothetical protein
MILRTEPAKRRELRESLLTADLVIAGGGLAGVCAAITAARAGIRVILAQDRPVLGGNSSSEVRLWILGATSHMGNNNRWAREGGVVDEILVENLYRNPEGNPIVLDSILLEKVVSEPNIQLLLNTAVIDLQKKSSDSISSLHAFCSQNSTRYVLSAPLFCDASGDGIVAFLAGAAFRMGAEGRDEFGEGFAPPTDSGELLGHSLYFYSKDAGHPVKFVPPSFALQDISAVPRFRDIRSGDSGCRFWWFEYGGLRDTVHDTEEIKWELWKVAYGAWNYIKNSGRFPDAENLTLEWMGTIPGKRESRRFEGDVILRQQDLVEQTLWEDAVSVGGWAMDLHPAEGVYSPLSPCTQWHSKGVYQIPYRCLYSRNVRNLFLAGRIISASHVAFGSTRVMATCGHTAQAVGLAAAICRRDGLQPADLTRDGRIAELQRELLKAGQYIPSVRLNDPADLAQTARVSASSALVLDRLEPGESQQPLDASRAMLLPLAAGPAPVVTFFVCARKPVTLDAELRVSAKPGNFTPDVTLARQSLALQAGLQQVRLDFGVSVRAPQYAFFCLLRNPDVSVQLSDQRVTGVLSLSQSMNRAVAKGATQDPPPGIGIDSFEFWLPSRRPGGRNLAVTIDPPIHLFGAENVRNGFARPTVQPNAWVAALDDPAPRLTACWSAPQRIGRIDLTFDTDFDHPMESVLMGHPEREIPFCVKKYRILDDRNNIRFECLDNHQTHNTIRIEPQFVASALHIEILETHGAIAAVPAAIFEARFYES